jgi:hypothetical protein
MVPRRYCDLCTETCVCPLTLTSRSTATVFGFFPNVIFSVESTANRAVAIGGVTAGTGLVLDFWH